MMDFGKMLKDEQAMKRFGNTFVVWRLSERKPRKIFDMPGAPLEIRCAINPSHDYAFTITALTSKIWLVYRDKQGEWQAKDVADIGDPAKVSLPPAFTISSDDRLLWATTFLEGKVRAFDISDPFHPSQVYEKQIGSQVNMVSSSWDSKWRSWYVMPLQRRSEIDAEGPKKEGFISQSIVINRQDLLH